VEHYLQGKEGGIVKKGFVIIVTVFLLSACSMPETKIYSLHLPVAGTGERACRAGDEKSAEAGAAIVIFVDSPRYLVQPYIAHRNSPYEIRISKYSRWVSPPSEMLKEVLKDSLMSTCMFREIRTSKSVPEGFYLFLAGLKNFERFDDASDSFGSMLFDAKLVSPGGKVLYQRTISKYVRLDDRTFLSLAMELSRAVSEGMEEVIKEIKASRIYFIP
jgi:ABC-type uncharacterized transport system auxiliary subunit